MEAALVVLVLLVVMVLAYVGWRGAIRARGGAFATVADSLTDGIYTHQQDHSQPTGGTFRAEGGLFEREVSVGFGPSRKGSDRGLLIYQVEVPEAACELEITPAGLLTRVKRRLGLTGNDVATGRFVLKSSSPQVVARLFQQDAFESAVLALLNEFESISLRGNCLSARRDVKLGDFALDPDAAIDILTELAELADLCRLPEVELVVREKGQAASGPAGLLCPYCRDGLDLAAEEATSCSECLTFHHSSCMEEAGGCTIFGCGNRPPEQVEA